MGRSHWSFVLVRILKLTAKKIVNKPNLKLCGLTHDVKSDPKPYAFYLNFAKLTLLLHNLKLIPGPAFNFYSLLNHKTYAYSFFDFYT